MISSPSDSEGVDPSVSSDEVDFEPEDELGSVGAVKAKMQKLRAELQEAKQKRDEYLDGWQRCKAEMVNAKREASEAYAHAGERGKELLVEELIPALDGFDMAMLGEGWDAVDVAWRSGIESIKSHIESALRSHGIEIYGSEGDSFDPMLHESIKDADGGDSGTIAQVFRRGYRTKERVLRPAQVAVFR